MFEGFFLAFLGGSPFVPRTDSMGLVYRGHCRGGMVGVINP